MLSKKLMIVSAATLFASTSFAVDLSSVLKEKVQQKPAVDLKQLSARKQMADFGIYRVEELSMVPRALADVDKVVSEKGMMSIVKSDGPIDLVNKNTVVRNLMTNELTSLTGNINVLLSEGARASDVELEFGLTLVANPTQRMAVFKAENQDLVELYKTLSTSALVSEARIELSDTIYVTE